MAADFKTGAATALICGAPAAVPFLGMY